MQDHLMDDREVFLRPTPTIDSDQEKIQDTARRLTEGCTDDADKAVRLFYFVRDSIRYNVFMISVFKEDFIASRILEWGKGYCVQKAVLLTALGRAAEAGARAATRARARSRAATARATRAAATSGGVAGRGAAKARLRIETREAELHSGT